MPLRHPWIPSQSFQVLPALLTLSSPLETSGCISGKNKNNNDPNFTSTGSHLSSEGFVYPHPTGWICHKDQPRAVVVSPAAAAPSLRRRFVLRGVRVPFLLRNTGSAFFTQLCSWWELVKLLGCPWTTLTHFIYIYFFFAWKNTWNVGRWVSRELCQHWAQTYIYTLWRLNYWASDPGRVCKRRFIESLLSNNRHDRGFNSLLDSTMLVLFWGFTPGPGCHDGAPSIRKHVTVKARTRRGSVRLRRLDLWQDISQSVCQEECKQQSVIAYAYSIS